MTISLLVIPILISITSIHHIYAAEIVSYGLEILESTHSNSSLLSLDNPKFAEISNSTYNSYHYYYTVSLNDSYTSHCNSIFITTCCDYIMDEKARYSNSEHCMGMSLDTTMTLYHKRKGKVSLLHESNQYPLCKNPGKSFIDLNEYSDDEYIIGVKGYDEEYGKYVVSLQCDQSSEDEPEWLWKVAAFVYWLSLSCGGWFVIFFPIGYCLKFLEGVSSPDPILEVIHCEQATAPKFASVLDVELPSANQQTQPSSTCRDNECATKIDLMNQMEFNVKAGGIDIYQVLAVYISYKWFEKSDEEKIKSGELRVNYQRSTDESDDEEEKCHNDEMNPYDDSSVPSPETISLWGRFILVFLMQTAFLSVVDVYLIYEMYESFEEDPKYCAYSRARQDAPNSGTYLALKIVAFVLSLVVMMKVARAFDDIKNRGLYRALQYYNIKDVYPTMCDRIFVLAKIVLLCGQGANYFATLLCLIGSFVIIFDTRDRSTEEDGSLDVIAAGITMILKILSIFYLTNVDSEFVLVREKVICRDYLKERRETIKGMDNCVKWKKHHCTKCCDGLLIICKVVLNISVVVYAGFVGICW